MGEITFQNAKQAKQIILNSLYSHIDSICLQLLELLDLVFTERQSTPSKFSCLLVTTYNFEARQQFLAKINSKWHLTEHLWASNSQKRQSCFPTTLMGSSCSPHRYPQLIKAAPKASLLFPFLWRVHILLVKEAGEGGVVKFLNERRVLKSTSLRI